MYINIASLLNYSKSYIDIEENIEIPFDLINKTNIIKLKDTLFKGRINYNLNVININGVLKGIMVLKDDITLDDVDYEFNIKIDEYFNTLDESNENNLKIINNSLDLMPFLWQNILLEVPLKISKNKSADLPKGNNWRVISEDELKDSNNSLSELQILLDKRKE